MQLFERNKYIKVRNIKKSNNVKQKGECLDLLVIKITVE